MRERLQATVTRRARRFNTRGLLSVAMAVPVALAAAIVAPGSIANAPAQVASGAGDVRIGGPLTMRRLNEAQYKRAIEDVFGAGLKVPGRFEPALRENGLMAIGDSKVSISSLGFEQYEMRAREVAAQVLAADRRSKTVPCTPASAAAFNGACATQFFEHYGKLLFRRPLTRAEVASNVALAASTTKTTGDFYQGLEIGLMRLLASPQFLFRVERGEPDPSKPGTMRLDGYSLASRISFLLWDSSPDAQLIAAAESGTLHKPDELQRQVDRLIASPRFADGVRAFFSDMFAYDQFEGLTKDQNFYPKYTSQLAQDAREQTLRTIVDLLVNQKGDYRDLFTTKKTFLNRNLGSLYQVPVRIEDKDAWVPYTFGPQDKRAGILTLAAFLMLDPTHEGRSSPTIRGKTVRELLLCQQVPLPPGNVDFSAVQNTADQVHRTARERLVAHSESPACAGCHAITDPIGLALENYDAVGAFRTHENGAAIDVTGKFEGQDYTDAISLQKILHSSPATPSCLVQRSYEYGVGRSLTPSEEQWAEQTTGSFAANGYAYPNLMRQIATSAAFRTVAPAQIASTK